MNDEPNPKQQFGDLKPNLALVPGATLIYLALGHEPGAAKYGAFNWRKNKVKTMTYIAAAMRHLTEWVDGQDRTHDTGQPHLAHALASLSVLVDAIETGNAIDNRPLKGKASVMIQMIELERRRAASIEREIAAIRGRSAMATPAPLTGIEGDDDEGYGLLRKKFEDYDRARNR